MKYPFSSHCFLPITKSKMNQIKNLYYSHSGSQIGLRVRGKNKNMTDKTPNMNLVGLLVGTEFMLYRNFYGNKLLHLSALNYLYVLHPGLIYYLKAWHVWLSRINWIIIIIAHSTKPYKLPKLKCIIFILSSFSYVSPFFYFIYMSCYKYSLL